MDKHYDIIIVGAGVAGSAAATTFARQGHEVLLLERSLKEPDRIVGELLQPGGVIALEKLGLAAAVEGIDAVPVRGYHIYWKKEEVTFYYPPINDGSRVTRPEGRSFHHGKFVSQLRETAKSEAKVTVIETTVTSLIIGKHSSRVIGVDCTNKGKYNKSYYSSLTLVADGADSNLRSQLQERKPLENSRFWGLELTDVELPYYGLAYGSIGNGPPILIYQIGAHHTRILIDIPNSVHKTVLSNGDIRTYIWKSVVPTLPEVVRPKVMSALESGRLRSMANAWLPAQANKTPGVLTIGDAHNIRHPLTGGGMTVALNDVVLLRDLLDPAAVTLDDIDTVHGKLQNFHWKRKAHSSSLNILAQALYTLFVADDPQLEVMQRGFVRYIQSGGRYVEDPSGLMGGIYHNPLLLVRHFFAIAIYSDFDGLGSTMHDRKAISAVSRLQRIDSWRVRRIGGPQLAIFLKFFMLFSVDLQDAFRSCLTAEHLRCIQICDHGLLPEAEGLALSAIPPSVRQLQDLTRFSCSTLVFWLINIARATKNQSIPRMSCICNASTVPINPRVGFVSQPNDRGTLGIVWSCLLVLFICVWNVLHHNLPSDSEGYWTIFWRKMRWATIAVTTPELLSLFAIMQWNAANISVRQMKTLGTHHWSIVHAFYANAGGFVLETPSFPPFPINATSLFYLVSQGRIRVPAITEKNIWDRSKADLFAKYVAFVQTGWLLCTTIARGAQKLPITPIELFTVAFIVPTLATQIFWAKKPQNVEEPVIIIVDWEIDEILRAAGPTASMPYVDTPMDFIEKPAWDGWKRRPSLLHFGGLERRPLSRIPNDYSPPPPTGKEATFIWVISVAHAGIHCIGWDFDFPTSVELLLWRVSSLTLLVFMAVGGIVPVLSTRPWFDFSFNLLWIWVRDAQTKTWMREWAFASLVNCAYAAYILARLIIFAEVFTVFRSLPRSAYEDVNWSAFWPHAK